jgi:hypothetical protein
MGCLNLTKPSCLEVKIEGEVTVGGGGVGAIRSSVANICETQPNNNDPCQQKLIFCLLLDYVGPAAKYLFTTWTYSTSFQ